MRPLAICLPALCSSVGRFADTQERACCNTVLEGVEMKILAIDTVLPEATPEKIKENFLKEVNHTMNMYLADVVREIYFRQDRSGTVLMLEAPSLEDARAMLDKLPMVKAGLINFELIPLGPFVPLALLLDEDIDRAAEAPTQ